MRKARKQRSVMGWELSRQLREPTGGLSSDPTFIVNVCDYFVNWTAVEFIKGDA